jgi:hypothetical protein
VQCNLNCKKLTTKKNNFILFLINFINKYN